MATNDGVAREQQALAVDTNAANSPIANCDEPDQGFGDDEFGDAVVLPPASLAQRKLLAAEIAVSLGPFRELVAQKVELWLSEQMDARKRMDKESAKTVEPAHLLPFPRRELSLAESCVVLAAIHDAAQEGEPFGPPSPDSLASETEHNESIGEKFRGDLLRAPFSVLINKASMLSEASLKLASELLRRLIEDLREQQAGFRASIDFRSVSWRQTSYTFTANQSHVVRVLYENWKNRTPEVGAETLLRSVDPDSPPARLNVLFRDHSAWGSLIVEGSTRGSYRLSI